MWSTLDSDKASLEQSFLYVASRLLRLLRTLQQSVPARRPPHAEVAATCVASPLWLARVPSERIIAPPYTSLAPSYGATPPGRPAPWTRDHSLQVVASWPPWHARVLLPVFQVPGAALAGKAPLASSCLCKVASSCQSIAWLKSQAGTRHPRHPPCASPDRSELSSSARCCRGMCCTFARCLPLWLLWPPRAKVPNILASRAFGQVRDAPSLRDLPRTQTRPTRAIRCSLSRCSRHEGGRAAAFRGL